MWWAIIVFFLFCVFISYISYREGHSDGFIMGRDLAHKEWLNDMWTVDRQKRLNELEKENQILEQEIKKLRELKGVPTSQFAIRIDKENERLEKENKSLELELRDTERDLEHRDTILSIMYDLVRNKEVTDQRKIRIIRKVIDVESGAAWTYKSKGEDVENFFKRIFKPYL